MFPPYPAKERQELKESIQNFGQFQPIVVSDGKVLDGRNRYEICLELGIEPKTIDFAEYKKEAQVNLSIAEFVFDSNVKRRHLTESQRAAIAAEFANMRQGERTDLEPSDNCLKVSQEEAASRFKVSAKSVGRAKKVKEKAPATFAKVKAGELSLNAAVESLTPAAVQPNPGSTMVRPKVPDNVSKLFDPATMKFNLDADVADVLEDVDSFLGSEKYDEAAKDAFLSTLLLELTNRVNNRAKIR